MLASSALKFSMFIIFAFFKYGLKYGAEHRFVFYHSFLSHTMYVPHFNLGSQTNFFSLTLFVELFSSPRKCSNNAIK
jgi:hypothetical protein